MVELFWLEWKKIFARKAVWLFFVAILLFQLLVQANAIRDTWNGTVQGTRDVYRRYEGQVINEAFQRQAAEDFALIALSHSDHFNTTYDEYQDSISYSANGSGYYAGVDMAYSKLINGPSVESLQRARVCSDAADKSFQEPPATPVVHDLGGWYTLGRTMGSEMLLLLLIVLGLLQLYTQESSSKMDGVLLSAAKRGRATAAKTLAAMAFTLGGALFVCGVEVLVVGLTLGLDGANMPLSALHNWSAASDETIAAFYALVAGVIVMAAVAWSALVVLASSLFRNPVAALLFAAVCLAAQMAIGMTMNSSSPLYAYSQLFPVPVLISPWSWLEDVIQAKYAAFALVFPSAIALFALGFAPRCFLKHRKA